MNKQEQTISHIAIFIVMGLVAFLSSTEALDVFMQKGIFSEFIAIFFFVGLGGALAINSLMQIIFLNTIYKEEQ